MFPDLPDQKEFWTRVFHNGFNCDYYKKYLDGQSREGLDHIYKCLTTTKKQNAFKDIYEVRPVLSSDMFF